MARLCHFRFGWATKQADRLCRNVSSQTALSRSPSERAARSPVPGVRPLAEKGSLHQWKGSCAEGTFGAEAANIPVCPPASRADVHNARTVQHLEAAIGYVERHKRLLGAESIHSGLLRQDVAFHR